MLPMIMNWLHNDEKGQSMAEYALILALIAVVCIIALGALGNGISDMLTTLSGSL